MKVHYYHPYLANDGKHKYYIITKSEKKIYFGAAGYTDFTKHEDVARKLRLLAMRKKTTGLNLVQILPDFGVLGYYGINNALKKVMKILQKRLL